MSTDENKALVRRWEELWNQGNSALADELFAQNFVLHDTNSPVETRGPEGYKQLIMTFRTAFPDLHVNLEEIVAEGEKVVVRWTARGRHLGPLRRIAPTGTQAIFTGIDIFRIVDGQITEDWSIGNALGIMQQLGVIPSMG